MVVRTQATKVLTRTVRTMSSFHRTAEAIRSRQQTVDEVLRKTIFSPKNFPKVLTVSIWFTTFEFYTLLGRKYYSRHNASTLKTACSEGTTSHAENSKWLNFVHQ